MIGVLARKSRATCIIFNLTRDVGEIISESGYLFVFVNFLNSLNSFLIINSRISTGLPLPEDSENARPRIDFIVLFVDLTNNLRYNVI